MQKNRLAPVLLISLLVMIDQAVKIIISRWFFDRCFGLVGDMLQFSPVHNTALSWVNSSLNLGIGFIPHLLLNAFLVVIVVLIYQYCKGKYAVGKGADAIFIFFIAGALCSLIDKIFWPGSLDYIYLKGFFTFDLKDVYLTTCEVLLVVLAIKYREVWHQVKLRQEARDFARYVYTNVCREKVQKIPGQGHEYE